MSLKNELKKKTSNKSRLVILFTFPLLLILAISGVIINHFNTNENENEMAKNEKEYQYDYKYDDNWEEVLKYTEEQREKYQNIDCECG